MIPTDYMTTLDIKFGGGLLGPLVPPGFFERVSGLLDSLSPVEYEDGIDVPDFMA